MAGMEEEEEVCEESTLAEYMQRVEEEELVRHSPSFPFSNQRLITCLLLLSFLILRFYEP